MITPKERAYLKKLAHHLDPLIIIGKEGLSENLLRQIEVTLDKRELVKLKILKNNLDDPRSLVDAILEATGADFVQHIGSKLTIYRPKEEPEIVFPDKA